MSETLKPETADQVLDAVRWAADGETPLDIDGAGTKRGFGRPGEAAHRLDLSSLAGIESYEPAELVITAAAATPLAEIEAALAEADQQLAFEPADLGPLFGAAAGAGTVGGAVACNLAGSRRLKAGAARDHLLGFHAASGRGELFKSGGRVMKNVTGFDLSKLVAGSFGTLAVVTELTLKVLPTPEKTRTVLVIGADDAAGARAMTAALQSPHEVSAAAHLPAVVAARSGVSYIAGAGASVTAVRVEGPGPSAVERCSALRGLLDEFGPGEELHGYNSAALWREVRDVAYFVGGGEGPVWRLSVAPTDGPAVVADILAGVAGEAYYDWGGGLVWLSLAAAADAHHERVRRAVDDKGGHATLIRAPDTVRAAVPVFHPQDRVVSALSARIKDGFDPRRVLNPGRMYAGI
jgi:glycolate oxidase FAD binding subunit